jgi:hypothetical protein
VIWKYETVMIGLSYNVMEKFKLRIELCFWQKEAQKSKLEFLDCSVPVRQMSNGSTSSYRLQPVGGDLDFTNV